jgi:hypothetical protein
MDSHFVYALKAQTFFHHRDRHPESALSVLESVARDPGRSAGELHLVKDDKDIREMSLVKEAGKRGEIGLGYGNDHGSVLSGK